MYRDRLSTVIAEALAIAVLHGLALYLLMTMTLGIEPGATAFDLALFALVCLALPAFLAWQTIRRRLVPGPLYLAGESGHKRASHVEAYSPDRRRGHRRL